jgi:hypothetical protein
MFFNQSTGLYGCYSTFELNDDVEEMPPEPVGGEWNDGLSWTRARLDAIEMRWYWDGDGVLEFRLPDGSWLSNTDCKKDYIWEYMTPVDHSKEWAE